MGAGQGGGTGVKGVENSDKFVFPAGETRLSSKVRNFPRDKPSKRTKPMLPIHRMIPGAKKILSTAACCGLVGCSVSASGPVTITKVNPYHLQSVQRIITEDEMIDFEHRRLLHGAINAEEQRDRFGNYFTIYWKSKRRDPVTVRLEYRLGKTGLQVHVQDEVVERPGRTNTTKFQVTGEDYHENGKVSQWRVSVVQDGAVVSEYKSYLWQ